MLRIVVDMQNRLFADAIASALQRYDMDFDVNISDNPTTALDLCLDVNANILVCEVTSHLPWRLEERFALRGAVRAKLPDCKIVFMVDENTERNLADKVIQAKKDNLIDQFIYGSVSSTYLAAVLDTL